ncbi:MAG: GtrA family protein [Terracidiphilus sp.]
MKIRPSESSRHFVRYLFVGGFNTLFGFAIFAFLNWLFSGLGSFSYMLAWALGNVIAITVAFLGYKWFVFRTRGNYLVEWVRCFGVYSSGLLFSAIALPVTVMILHRTMHRPEYAPYFAAAVLTVVTVVFNFLGHKHFSFRSKSTEI